MLSTARFAAIAILFAGCGISRDRFVGDWEYISGTSVVTSCDDGSMKTIDLTGQRLTINAGGLQNGIVVPSFTDSADDEWLVDGHTASSPVGDPGCVLGVWGSCNDYAGTFTWNGDDTLSVSVVATEIDRPQSGPMRTCTTTYNGQLRHADPIVDMAVTVDKAPILGPCGTVVPPQEQDITINYQGAIGTAVYQARCVGLRDDDTDLSFTFPVRNANSYINFGAHLTTGEPVQRVGDAKGVEFTTGDRGSNALNNIIFIARDNGVEYQSQGSYKFFISDVNQFHILGCVYDLSPLDGQNNQQATAPQPIVFNCTR